ncbi:MAG TPA: response regulator transcription factor [Candidatus Limnocylindria bacterium]|nr:response regulator transcription factor [Candidatus Limnocylindria bacterium]
MVGGGAGSGHRYEILLVDDEQALVDLLAFIVQQAGYIPLVATEPTGALELLERQEPIVALIDLNHLHPWDGFELLVDLRRRRPSLPIIVLTARSSEDDKVRALDLGADDYVVKPFGHRELLARIRAHARRAVGDRAERTPAVMEVGSFRLDPGERTLYLDGVPTRLTGTEFRLLQYLMSHSDAVVPTAAVAKHVWGFNDAPARDVVRVTVHRLRRKLGDDGERQKFIHTVPGVGLRLRTG